MAQRGRREQSWHGCVAGIQCMPFRAVARLSRLAYTGRRVIQPILQGTPPMTLHRLDLATALSPGPEGRLAGVTSDHYWNFAGPFGGYIAALLMRAVMQDERRLGPPVAQTVNYCGPLAKGGFEIALTMDRGGKATQHWSAKLLQGEATVATATIVCANRRETFAFQNCAQPQVPPPEEVPVAAAPPALPWLSSYEFRFIEGPPQFDRPPRTDGTLDSSRTALWLADKPARPLDYVALSSLADCFVLRLVQMRGRLAPMSTVSMTTYFHADEREMQEQGSAPLLGIADAKRFVANFHDQSMELWGKGGRLLASGIQTVWYRE